jgi:hypothetical protein
MYGTPPRSKNPLAEVSHRVATNPASESRSPGEGPGAVAITAMSIEGRQGFTPALSAAPGAA